MFFDGVMMIFSKVYMNSKDKRLREDALQLNFLLVLEVCPFWSKNTFSD